LCVYPGIIQSHLWQLDAAGSGQ